MFEPLLGHARRLALVIVLLILCVVFSRISLPFLTFSNFMTTSTHLAEAGIIACGMTLVIMTGGIDLSVGSMLGLCGIVLGYTWVPLGSYGAVTVALATGLIGGALNGTLIVRGKLPPLVVTLGTMALFRGIAMAISKAQPFSEFPDSFQWVGQGTIGEVPTQLLLWLSIAGICIVITVLTPAGRYLEAIGDSELAARYAAVPVDRAKWLTYVFTGFLSAIAAIVFTSRVSTAKADAGQNLELEVITAVVLGGTAITGGNGSVFGTVLGVLILGFLRNGLNLAGVPSVYQLIVAGALLIVISILNQFGLRERHRRPRNAPKVLEVDGNV